MSWRFVVLGAVVATGLTGCAGLTASDDGFGVTTVTAEGPPPSTRQPLIAGAPQWGEPIVIPVVQGPRAVAEADGPYLLDTGDRLRVFVYGQPNLSRIYAVDHDGHISVPLIGHVKARGLTTGKLERSVRDRLGAQYVKDPHVTIDVSQNRPFFILGKCAVPANFLTSTA